ncbi:MAG: RNA polymerase sigma factor [Bacteroidota bacterium]
MDEEVFRAFYERTNRALWLYIAGMVKDNELADDLFQESYIKVLQSRIEYKNEPQMKSYLYRTATNCMRDHWRKMKREREWFEAEGGEAAEVRNPIELRHDLQAAFSGLSLQQRSLLWLAYAEEYEHKEIADILMLKEKSVKVLLFRAKHKLIELAGKLGITREVTP